MLLDFLGPGGASSSYSTAMHEVAAKNHVPVVVYKGPRADIVHPTREGYRMLAEQTLAGLVAAQCIPEEAGSGDARDVHSNIAKE
jgi:phospholipase/lecithinase/hemolysin